MNYTFKTALITLFALSVAVASYAQAGTEHSKALTLHVTSYKYEDLGDKPTAHSCKDYRTAVTLVPAAAKTSVASCSAMGMNACTTPGSNWLTPLRSRRAIASGCGRPCR